MRIHEKLLCTFPRGKSGKEQLRISRHERNGRPYFDIRNWYMDGAGTWSPNPGAIIFLEELAGIGHALLEIARDNEAEPRDHSVDHGGGSK